MKRFVIVMKRFVMKRFVALLLVVLLILSFLLVFLLVSGYGCRPKSPQSSDLQEKICEAVGTALAEYENQLEADLQECEKEKIILQNKIDDLQSQLSDCNVKMATFEEQIADLKAQLAKCNDCSNCEAMLADCQDDLKDCNRRICELLEELEKCKGWEIDNPQIVGQVSHRQMIEFLRKVFPNAEFRGVEEAEFDLTNKSEIERFLDEMPERNFSDQGDFVWFLMGEFTNQSGWENIPIGWAKVSDGDFYAVVVVKESGQLVAFKITSSLQLQKISSSEAKFVLIG